MLPESKEGHSSKTQNFRLIVADDHQMFVDGVLAILSTSPDLQVVATASNGKEAWNLVQSRGEIDLVITDLSMPEMGGLELTRLIRRVFPETKVLVLTMHDDREIIQEVMESEADGYVLKNSGKRELLRAVGCLLDGGVYYSSSILSILSGKRLSSREQGRDHLLSKREQEILGLICEELTSREIADRLFISPRTVETHRKNILKKTGAQSLVGLIKIAVQSGWVA